MATVTANRLCLKHTRLCLKHTMATVTANRLCLKHTRLCLKHTMTAVTANRLCLKHTKAAMTIEALKRTRAVVTIGQFSEAGLLEWMCFVIFHARSRERLQHTSSQFLSRRFFTMCITVEVEPRIAKQYKCQYCCSCKNYRGKGMEGGKKCLCVVFWLTRRSWVHRKNAFWGILQHEQQVTAYCQTHYDYGPPKMPLKLAV